MIAACGACGSTDLQWHHANEIAGGAPQHRLSTSDVKPVFFLGCNACSETLDKIGADDVIELLQQQLKKG